jgi:aryl-phospho-beta-D-glucosidase BglC (GH1 family)
MRRSFLIVLICVFVGAFLAFNVYDQVQAAGELTVFYKCANTSATSNTIRSQFQVKNNTSSAIALSTIKIRYWYTIDTTQPQSFACDYAQIGAGNITNTFTSVSAGATANYYLEIGFSTSAGNLAAGANSGDIQIRFNKNDYSNYTQTNDYSFDATMINFTQSTKVTGYLNGVLVFGTEPGDTTTTAPTVAPTPVKTATPRITATPVRTATPRMTATPVVATVTPSPAKTPTPVPATPTPVTVTPTPGGGATLPGDDWLHVSGNKLLDANGKAVWLTGTNWFGYNTGTNAFDGVWSVNMIQALTNMANRGFNLLRVPISAQLINQWAAGTYPAPNVNTYANPDLVGKNSLEIFDAVVQDCKNVGMKIMLDIHCAKTDPSGHNYPVWYNSEASITSEDYYKACEWITARYKNDDTIIAFDLKNEPHGKPYKETLYAKWDNSTDANNWKYAAEICAKRVLTVNPNILIVVEGIECYPKDKVTWTSTVETDYYGNWWGGNLRPVKDYPLNLGTSQGQLLYSPHDYGPKVYAQPWFYAGFNKTTLYNDVWKDNWAYIVEQGIAPLLIGEWGGFMDGGDNEKWMKAIRDFIIEKHIHHTFWCYNSNSSDTGGLSTDFVTWDEVKYALVKPSLWQDANGKFVGLDHVKPLGTNINVTTYYLNGGTPPTP